MTIFNRFIYPLTGGVFAVALVIVVLMQFDTPFKSFLIPEKTAVKAPQAVTFESELPVVGDLEVGPAEEPVEEPGEEKSLPPIATKSLTATPQPLIDTTDEDAEVSEAVTGVGGGGDGKAMPEMMPAMAPMMMVEEIVESDDSQPDIRMAEAQDAKVEDIDIRDKASNLLLQIEKLMEENSDDISDELKTLVGEKVNALADLLKDEKEDVEAIEKAIEELKNEALKIDPEFDVN